MRPLEIFKYDESRAVFYRCYFLGRDGGIVDRLDFHADDDASAVSHSRAKYAETPEAEHGFELWEASRQVHKDQP